MAPSSGRSGPFPRRTDAVRGVPAFGAAGPQGSAQPVENKRFPRYVSVASSPPAGGPRRGTRTMKAPIAHFSQTTLAALAAATSIWLAVFVLPGAQRTPLPLAPVIGGAAEVVAAPFEAPARRAPSAAPRAASPVAATARPAAPSRIAVVPRRARRPHPTVRPRPSVPIRPAVSIQVPAAPAEVSQQSSGPPSGQARALGHTKAAAPRAGVGVRGRGQGKALGHDHGLPPGQSKRMSPARAVPPQAGPGSRGEGHGGGKR